MTGNRGASCGRSAGRPMRPLVLALLASVSLATAAQAVTPPLQVGPTFAGHTFDAPGSTSWTVRLTKGQDYALETNGDARTAVVRDAGGRTLATAGVVDYGTLGATFRAPYQ